MGKVLVTGACGFVGSHLVELLVDEGFDVRATDLEWADKKHIRKHFGSGRFGYIPADLRKPETLGPVVDGVETIFHPGGLFNLTIDDQTLYDVNVRGTENLCRTAVRSGVKKLINWSSSSIYGCWEDSAEKTEEDRIDEERIHNYYARSKYGQELIAQGFDGVNGMRVVSIRPADVYGPRTLMGLAMPLKSLAAGLLKRPPAIKKNGKYLEARCSHVHVKDVAGAAVFLSATDKAEGIYNVSEDEAVSNADLFRVAARHLGLELKGGYENPAMFRALARLLKVYCSVENFVCSDIFRRDYKRYPLFDAPSVEFTVKNHIVGNRKIRGLGFEFRHKILEEVPDLVETYRGAGLKDVLTFSRYSSR